MRAASASTSASHPECLARLADLSRRVGADLLVNVDAPLARVVSTSRRSSSDRTDHAARTRRRGWCPSASTCRCARCSAGSPVTPRRQPRTGGAAVGHRSCCMTGLARHRTADQLRSDLLRPSAPGGAARRPAAGYQSSTSTFQGTWAQPQLASQAAVHAAEVGHPAVAGSHTFLVRHPLDPSSSTRSPRGSRRH